MKLNNKIQLFKVRNTPGISKKIEKDDKIMEKNEDKNEKKWKKMEKPFFIYTKMVRYFMTEVMNEKYDQLAKPRPEHKPIEDFRHKHLTIQRHIWPK